MAQNFVNYSNDRNSYWKNDGPDLYTPMKGTSAVGASVFRPSANVKNQLGITGSGDSSGGSGGSGGYGGYGGGYSGYSYSSGPIGYNLDLSAFQKSRDAIIAGANNAKNMLKNQYDRLLAELDKKTKEGNEQFGRGRATISEDAYDRSRENLNSLAARGLAGSGLQQLGEVQERMETGQQMNDLASQYYAYLDDIDTQRKEGEAQYNEGIQSIEDSLQQQLANIGLQEFQAQDDYNRYMSNLAMQLAEVQGYNAGRSIVQGNADSKLALAEAALLGTGQAFDNGLYGTDYDAYNSDVRKALQNYIAAGGQDATKYAQMLALSFGDGEQTTSTDNSGKSSSSVYNSPLANAAKNWVGRGINNTATFTLPFYKSITDHFSNYNNR